MKRKNMRTDDFKSIRETAVKRVCTFFIVSNDPYLNITQAGLNANRNFNVNKFVTINYVDNKLKNGFFRDIGCEDFQDEVLHRPEGSNPKSVNSTFIYDLVRISKFVGLKIKYENVFYIRFKAPLDVGIVNLSQTTNQFILTFRRKTLKHGRLITENNENEAFVLESAFPVANDFKLRKNTMAKNDNGEYEYTEEGIIVHHPSDLHECIYKAITDGQTVLPPQINRFCYNGADADVKNESYFYNINYWSELLELVDTSSLKAIEPGKNRQIYLVFDAKEKIGVHIDAIAEEDEEYTIRNIGGMLHPIGPVRFVRKDTSVFTIVFTPKRIKDDYNSEKFVWTRVFPGYPYVNYLLDGLKEGDIIYGSEVNARNLSPIAPDKKKASSL